MEPESDVRGTDRDGFGPWLPRARGARLALRTADGHTVVLRRWPAIRELARVQLGPADPTPVRFAVIADRGGR